MGWMRTRGVFVVASVTWFFFAFAFAFGFREIVATDIVAIFCTFPVAVDSSLHVRLAEAAPRVGERRIGRADLG